MIYREKNPTGMKVCPDCHKVSRDGEEFCQRCGCRFDAYIAANGDPETQSVRDTAHRMVRGKYRAHRNRNILAVSLVLILLVGTFILVGSGWNSTTLVVEVGSSDGSPSEYTVYVDGAEVGSGWTASTAFVEQHFTWGLWQPTKTVTVVVDYGSTERTGQADLVNGQTAHITLLK